tara:strand:- start:11 stop:292 length:282 start_codon:yes stop_codon:yes gene_type:complete
VFKSPTSVHAEPFQDSHLALAGEEPSSPPISNIASALAPAQDCLELPSFISAISVQDVPLYSSTSVKVGVDPASSPPATTDEVCVPAVSYTHL